MNNNVINYTVISSIYEGGALKGFVLVSDMFTVTTVLLDQLKDFVSSSTKMGYAVTGKQYVMTNALVNAKYDEEYNTLVGTEEDLVNYPKVDMNYTIIENNGLTVLATILDAVDNKPVGCIVYTGTGLRYNISYKKMQKLATEKVRGVTLRETNYKLIPTSDGLFAVPKKSSKFREIAMKMKTGKKLDYRSANGEVAPACVVDAPDDSTLPEVSKIYSLDDVKNSDFSTDTQQKMYSVGLALRQLAPYYSCMFDAIEKEVRPNLPTMTVSETKFFYGVTFPAQHTVAELTFIVIHEMMHIAMRHAIRGKGKIHELWNIATDLYINTIIQEDFKVRYEDGEKVYDIKVGDKYVKVGIQVPEFVLTLDKSDIVFDLSRETPETIYKQLLEENPQYQNKQMSDIRISSESGSQNNDGQQDDNQQHQDDGQQGQDGQEQGQGQGQGQDESQSSEQQSNNGQGEDGEPQNSNNQGNAEQDEGQQNGDMKRVTVTYNGKKITGTIIKDICSNDSSGTEESDKKNDEDSKKTLQKIKTKVQMTEEQLGESISRDYGIGSGALCRRYVDFGLADNVDWRVLLKNICIKKPKRMYTMAMPNVDYMNMGVTLAERHKIGKPTAAGDFVIAIDVSGSVSEETLNRYMSEVASMIKHYDIEAELVYWSTAVGNAENFSSMKDILKIEPSSTGGTDVSCLFRYLLGQEEVNGKKEKLLPKQIKGIFIITDGYFAKNYQFAENAFGRKVVWLIDGNPILFSPLFGKVMSLGYRE